MECFSMFDSGFYSEKDLVSAGIKSCGSNVHIAKNCTIIGLKKIRIGSNVRIDGYCTIMASGSVTIGSYVHIGAYSFLSGAYGIALEDFCGLSQGVRIHSSSDDYGGNFLTNPMVPEEFKSTQGGEVTLGKHCIVGSGSTILPGVTFGQGASLGAMSLATKNLEEWGVYFGIPARRLKNRKKKLLDHEASFLRSSQPATEL